MESGKFDATSSGAQRRANQGSVGMSTQSGARGGPPPRKDSGFVVQDPAAQPAAASGAVGGGAAGRRSAARANANAMMSQRGPQKARPRHPWLDFPPAFEYAVSRQAAFLKRVFSPQALFEPLPAPIRLSLERNFGFFTKIFTQFIDPHQQKEIRQALPGIGRRD